MPCGTMAVYHKCDGAMRAVKLETVCALSLFLALLVFTVPIQATGLLSQSDDLTASWLMSVPGLRQLAAARQDLAPFLIRHRVGTVRQSGFYNDYTKTFSPYEKAERGIIPEDALMLAGGMGAFYYLPDLRVIDHFGLVDYAVARNPVVHGNDKRQMAHDRKPSRQYLKERAPNIYVLRPAGSLDDAMQVASYAVEVNPGLWMPFDAVNALWAKERFGQRNFHAVVPPLAPIVVVYERGLSLHGFAVWHDGPGKPLRWASRWRVAPDTIDDYVLSMRLHNIHGHRMWQSEDVMQHPILPSSGSVTSAWPPDKTVDVLLSTPPPDIEIGEYEVRIVVYDFRSGAVTAEMDTWRTEITVGSVRYEGSKSLKPPGQ